MFEIVQIKTEDPSYPSSARQYLKHQAPKHIYALGDLKIIQNNMLGLICSVKCPGKIILQTYELMKQLRDTGMVVISGFHSPMERECLRILKCGHQPIVICAARSLDSMRINAERRKALKENRLLMLSIFGKSERRATTHASLQRNRFVAAVAEKTFVPYAEPDCKTERLCREVISWGKQLYTFDEVHSKNLIDIGLQILRGDMHSAVESVPGVNV
jgi:predicted Rossmann fold nucleotide-binding protein DprA/Smf involved in DNA uptake